MQVVTHRIANLFAKSPLCILLFFRLYNY